MHDLCHPCTNPPHPNPQKMKGFEMLNDIKIEFFEDDLFQNKIGFVHLSISTFSQLERIIKTIKQSQNDLGNPCHFKIIAESLDY